jgi:hypothetical protein
MNSFSKLCNDFSRYDAKLIPMIKRNGVYVDSGAPQSALLYTK